MLLICLCINLLLFLAVEGTNFVAFQRRITFIQGVFRPGPNWKPILTDDNIITFFFMGSSLGLLPSGLISDRFGRKPVMWGGLTIYIAGAIGSILAPSLTWPRS